uniref:Metalloendopeptidase n=1 Tax=Parastrongyloides trichosuri TaxID=131310 RepID=A0A0N4ZM57_PARTI
MILNFILLLWLFASSDSVKIYNSFSANIKENDLTRDKRSIVTAERERWRFPLSYFIEDGLNKDNIKAAIKKFESQTCLRFFKSTRLQADKQGLHFQPHQYCGTIIGNIYGDKAHVLGVDDYCNSSVGALQYLMGYTFGMVNQQSRSDRDKYVDVFMENVEPDDVLGFRKYDETEAEHYGLGYDFGSIFQYGIREFSVNGNYTILPKVILYKYMMGQRVGFSFNDYKLLNFHYCQKQIRKSAGKKLTCLNSGYPDPNKKGKCKCPHGYAGQRCDRIDCSDKKCAKTKYIAKSKYQKLKVQGKKNCTFLIQAPKGHRINIKVLQSITPKGKPCLKNSGLEIKHYKDKGATGLCVCGMKRDYELSSEDNKVLVIYKGLEASNMVQMEYKSYKQKNHHKPSHKPKPKKKVNQKGRHN